MREFIIENLTDTQSLNVGIVLLNSLVAFIVSFFIMFTYKITYSGSTYSRKFNISIGMITLITAMIMAIISNNVALSLGMVGALSIIRFRTAVKDVRDAVFIFWSIAAGIGCGVSQYLLVGISSIVIFIFLILMRQVIPENQHLLIIRGKVDVQNKVESTVVTYFSKSAHQTMKNATPESMELIYRISEGAIYRAKKKDSADIVEQLTKIEGVTHVNLVEQLDDIGR